MPQSIPRPFPGGTILLCSLMNNKWHQKRLCSLTRRHTIYSPSEASEGGRQIGIRQPLGAEKYSQCFRCDGVWVISFYCVKRKFMIIFYVPLPIVKTKKGVVFGGLAGSFLALLLARDRRNRPHKASYTPGIHVVFPCCKDRNTPLALPSPLLQFRSS